MKWAAGFNFSFTHVLLAEEGPSFDHAASEYGAGQRQDEGQARPFLGCGL